MIKVNRLDYWIFSKRDDMGTYSKEEKENLYRLFKISMSLWIPIFTGVAVYSLTRSELVLIGVIVLMLINWGIFLKANYIKNIKRNMNEQKG